MSNKNKSCGALSGRGGTNVLWEILLIFMLEINNKVKKILIYVVGWLLFLVSLVLCLVGGIVAGGFATNNALSLGLENFHPLYDGTSLISFVWIVFVLSFLCSVFFSMFILAKGLSRIIFSLATSFLFVFVMLWYAHELTAWGTERVINMGCVLGKNPGHVQTCVTMSEQERKKFMKDNNITERDLDVYRKKYLEK